MVKKIPRALPFARKELSLGALCITLHTNSILCKIHEVTPDETSIQNHKSVIEIKIRDTDLQEKSDHFFLLNCYYHKSHFQVRISQSIASGNKVMIHHGYPKINTFIFKKFTLPNQLLEVTRR